MDETIQQDFENEITRLTALHIPDEELEIARRYYSDKERKSMPASAFCGPGRSFPVQTQEDVTNAAGLAGHAANPDAVRACIKRKAKAGGWSLPKSWTDGSKDRAMETEQAVHMYVPITRIDPEKWTVEGQATSDAIDSYGTIFDYDSSKRAFATWRGNMREMHQLKAVGHALEVIPNDDNHTITVRAFVSKGSPDTWEKVKDGTLTGFSIGVPKDRYKLKQVERNGRNVPMYYDHELAELSLVDNPGSPGCNIAIVRADGVATEVLDDSEETTPPESGDIARAGQRISHATQSDLHGLRDGHLQGVAKAIAICLCDECQALSAILSPDGDDDIDVVSSLDYDNDGGKGDGSMNYALGSAIERQLNPLLTRVHAMLSSHAARPQIQAPTISTEPIERRIADVEHAFDTRLTEVRSLVSEVKALAEKIAAQPAPGGPIMTPVDKRLATSPQQGYRTQDEDIAALSRASQLVNLSPEDQVALAAEIIKRQNRG